MALNVSAWAIRKPIPPLVLFVILVALGVVHFRSLPVTRMPNIDLPIVLVTITQPGAAPSELETQVTKKVENAIAGVTGVKHITSSISEGASLTVVEFFLETNVDRAVNDTRDAVTKIRAEMPGSIDEPVKFALTTDLLRLTFPFLLFVSLTALAGGILNSFNKFALPALTPIILNVCMIAGALWLSPHLDVPIMAMGWAILAAGILQLLVQFPALRKLDLLVLPRWGWRHPGVRKVLRLMVPTLFGSSVAQINLLLDTLLKTCSPLTRLCIAVSLTAPEEYIKTRTIAGWKKDKPDLHKKPAERVARPVDT